MVRNRRAALAALSASGLGAALGAQTATAWSATPWIAPEGGIPLLPPGDLGAFRLTGSATRDARLELVTLDPADEPQDAPGTRRALRVRTERVPASPWLIQLTGKTTGAVGRGDAVLVTFFMRTLESAAETDEGRVGVVFEQASDPYTKSLSVTVGTEAGAGWRRYDLPLTTLAGYAAGQAQVNFQLGHGPQTVEIAGVSVLDFGAQTPVASLPRTPLTYAGREADAAWRDEARARIERYRMGDLEVRVVDGAGHPIPAAAVAVSQRRHAFGFGSAVATAQLMAPTADGERYRDHARRNFSKAVLENDLKWPN
ncbi:MAG TPA: hypothetical protein VFX49_11910, partial [Chloroflexota bacterium]|nr:hypothetical protein [Chloroflexota bacterium]